MTKKMKTVEDFNKVMSRTPWNTIHGKAWRRSVKIGVGGFGSVHIGQREEDRRVFAVKSAELHLNHPDYKINSNLFALRNEIMTLSQLRCKYIIRMLGCGRSNGTNSYKSDEKKMMDLFLEYIPRGSLHHLMKRLEMGATTAFTDLGSAGSQKQPANYGSASSNQHRLKRFPEDYVRAYTADILRAVDYLHRKQFVHGDIKPLNLLVAGDCLKLADFGGCKTLKQQRLDHWVTRTEIYAAPEVYYKIEQGFASDIFSVGCCILEMTAGFLPDTIFIPQWLSRDGQNFLRRCLTDDPSKRWTAAQLLEHPFIRDRNQNDTRPWSTGIPAIADNMIIQPPPVEFYTNTMFSPTWRGEKSFLPHADPKDIYKRIHEENTHKTFRKEKIKISSGQSPSPSQPAQADGTGDSDSSTSTSYFSMIPAVSAVVDTPAPPTTFRTDPKAKHGDSSTTGSTAAKEHKTILPDYKPEFEPPGDNSLHFLVPGPGVENNKDEDLDARAAALLKETPKTMQIRPPPFVISDKPTDSITGGLRKKPESQQKHVTMAPLSALSEEEWKQLNEVLPKNFEKYNEEIKLEARKAEEAGIYDNKLCPSAGDEENDPKILFPTLASSSIYNPILSRMTNILKGFKTCKEVDNVHSPSSEYHAAESTY